MEIYFRIPLHDIAAYVHVFLVDAQRVPGEIDLDVSHVQHGDVYALLAMAKKHPDLKIRVIFPCLQLLCTNPNNSANILEQTKTQMADLQSIFDELIVLPRAYKAKKWSFYFDKAVKEIRLIPSHVAGVKVSLVLKASERAWWMGKVGKDRVVGERMWREKTECSEGVKLCGWGWEDEVRKTW